MTGLQKEGESKERETTRKLPPCPWCGKIRVWTGCCHEKNLTSENVLKAKATAQGSRLDIEDERVKPAKCDSI